MKIIQLTPDNSKTILDINVYILGSFNNVSFYFLILIEMIFKLIKPACLIYHEGSVGFLSLILPNFPCASLGSAVSTRERIRLGTTEIIIH